MSDYNNPYPNPDQNRPPQPSGEEPGKGAAIGSLVCGIVGLFFAGIILGIVGLVLSSKSKNEGFEGGLRTAGFILSLLALIFGAVSVCCIVCSGGLACIGSL